MNSQLPLTYTLNRLDKTQFLNTYWQTKPLILRQAFTDFIDPLDEDELAGLAQEPEIDARIVSCQDGLWNVIHGPIDDFNQACVGAWSLLVQSVDQHLPLADSLMAAFDFIPHWRMDDLMVSFSNQGAGVGAHIDQYDVFIIQGKGSRRWQVGSPGDYIPHFPHADLRQIEAFEPLIDEVLLPGDVIYIPPGFPHKGVALEDCLNYSVGFRAPSQQEMLSSLADFVIDEGLFNQRYKDNTLSQRRFPGEIKHQEIGAFKDLFQQILDSDHFPRWLGHYLSHSQANNPFDEADPSTYAPQQITAMLNSGIGFIRQLGVKAVFVENQPFPEQDFTFYIEGQEFSVPQQAQERVKTFLNSSHWRKQMDPGGDGVEYFIQIVAAVVNAGFWYPEH